MDDESWYFTDSKKIKISSAKEGGKKTVIVHAECLKQIELSREQVKSKRDQEAASGQTDEVKLGKRAVSEVTYEED